MKNENRTKSSIKNVFFALLYQFVNILLNYVCRFIFVKVLSEEYLGVNGLFSNILTIFSLAELGIGSAIIYAMYKPISDNDTEKIKNYMSFYKKCYSIIAVVILIIGLVLLPNINFFINNDTNIKDISIIYLLYLLDSVSSYLFVYKSSILNAMQKNYICNLYQMIGKILMSIFMCLGLVLFKNFIIYLVIQVIFKLIVNISISMKADKMYPYIKDTKNNSLDKVEKKKIYKNVYSLFCNQIGTVLINGTDNIIISKYVNLIAVGLYSNYFLVTNALTNFIGQIFNSIVASVGNLAVVGTKDKIYDLFEKVHFINYIISSFCVVVIFSCINTFIVFSFGEQYLLDNYVVIIVILNFYLYTMKNVVGTFKYALGIFWNDKYCTLIRAVINLIFSIVFVKSYGLIGVFLGTLVSDLVTTFWFQPYILFKKGLEVNSFNYFKDFFKYTFITFIIIVINTLILKNVMIDNNILLFIIEVLVSSIVFGIVNLILFRNKKEFLFFKDVCFTYLKKIRK